MFLLCCNVLVVENNDDLLIKTRWAWRECVGAWRRTVGHKQIIGPTLYIMRRGRVPIQKTTPIRVTSREHMAVFYINGSHAAVVGLLCSH